MKSDEIVVIILAAGYGRRLSSISNGATKGLVMLNGKSLVQRALDFTRLLQPSGTIVVGGYQSETLRTNVVSEGRNTRLKYAYNSDFSKGSYTSVFAALELINDEGFYLFNVDHIYPEEFLQTFETATTRRSITVFADRHRQLGEDDMKIASTDGLHVSAMSKTLTQYMAGYIGVSFVPSSMVATYKQSLLELVKENPTNISAEAIIDRLARKGHMIDICFVAPKEWLEIDTPDDYLLATLSALGN